MAAVNLRQDERNFINNLYAQGILDCHFDEILEIRNLDNPQFLLELISIFCADADKSIAELNIYLSEPAIDYSKVIGVVHQLKGGSSSIGGNRMAIACRELRLATDDMDKERCRKAFGSVQEEYQILKTNLNIISQMESAVLSNEVRK